MLPILSGCLSDAGGTFEAQEQSVRPPNLEKGGGKAKDRAAPSITITDPVSGSTVTGTITAAGNASDNVGLRLVEVALDNGSWVQARGTLAWSLALDTSSLADGAHTLTARATDLSGNQTSASVGFSVASQPAPPSTSPPTVSITAPAGGATVSGAIVVSGSSTNSAKVEVSVDSGPYAAASGTSAWSLGLSTTGLADGSHSITARATGSSGLQATSTTWITVSNAAPGGLAVGIASPTSGAGVSGMVTVTGTANGASRLRVRVDAYAYLDILPGASWSYSFDSAALANGPHTLVARADDASGSSASTQITFTSSNVNVPPALSITTPAGGATVSGLVEVSGFASDLHGVGQAEVAVDGGPYQCAQGMGRFVLPLDTATLSNGTHVLSARVSDGLGATTTTSITVKVANAEVVPPSISIASPKAGATVSGTITVSGGAADNAGLSHVEVKESYGVYLPASGTVSWSQVIDTRGLSNGSHTLTARAVDTNGNVSTAAVSVIVANGHSLETLVTPEGARIEIDSAAGWSAEAIYQMLKESALDLDQTGPTLTIRIDDLPGASTQVSCSATSCTSLMHLGSGTGSTFAIWPQRTLVHEYGHVWSLRHLYLSQGGSWASYLQFRGLDVDPRLDSAYPSWDRAELIADDYRELFGAPVAQGYSHPLAHPASVSGLAQFLTGSWAAP